MIDALQKLGQSTITSLIRIGRAGIMFFFLVFNPKNFVKNFRSTIDQIFYVGVLSLPIIVVSGLFIGMVIALQGYNTLNDFGASTALGQLVALSILRELGPVVAALLFAGRACSAITAEIGLMKATEQLSSMEMMGVDSLGYVVAPRFWAGVISLPLLTMIFEAIAIWGGYLVGVKLLGVDSGTFWSNMQSGVHFYDDVIKGLYKNLAFGVVAMWIAVYQGNNCVPTAEGIGRATTRTVVYASVAILGLDFILTAMMMGGW
jgi:phospholipid/cholesterol/gamma-HCH transport system permease protein